MWIKEHLHEELKHIYYEAYTSEEDAREREKQRIHFGNAYKFLIKRIKNRLTG